MIRNRIAIFALIGTVLFYSVLISVSDFKEFSNELSLLKKEFIPIILLLHFSVMFCRAIRQKFLFDSLDVKLSLKEHVYVHFSGLALIMTPGGLGQTVKAYYLKEKKNLEYSKTISISLVERFYDLFSIIPILFVMSFFVNSNEIRIVTIIVTLLLLTLLALIKNKKTFNLLISIVPKISIFKKISDNSNEIYEIFGKLTHRNLFSLSLLIGIISWMIAGTAFYLSFLAFNIDLSFFETTLISLVPITIGTLSFLPGGIIATEMTMLGFLENYNINGSLATAVVLFTRITSIWFLTLVGIICTKIVYAKIK